MGVSISVGGGGGGGGGVCKHTVSLVVIGVKYDEG